MPKLSYLILAVSLVAFSGACAEQKGKKKDDKKADKADKKDKKDKKDTKKAETKK